MTQDAIHIKAINRSEINKPHIRSVRKSGYVPAVVYSHGKSLPIAVLKSDLPKSGHTHLNLVTLDLEGKAQKVLMREVQIHPMSLEVLHMDFQSVEPSDVVRVNVPLAFGALTVEQQKLGNLKKSMRSIEVRAIFSNIPKSISIPVDHLKDNESVRLHDIEIPKDLQVKTGRGKNVVLATLSK